MKNVSCNEIQGMVFMRNVMGMYGHPKMRGDGYTCTTEGHAIYIWYPPHCLSPSLRAQIEPK